MIRHDTFSAALFIQPFSGRLSLMSHHDTIHPRNNHNVFSGINFYHTGTIIYSMMYRRYDPPRRKIIIWCFRVAAVLIAAFVLLVPPRPGVADQGDFQRIMDIAGLQETESTLADPDSRFFQYAKTDYVMTSVNPLRLFGIPISSSMFYPIMLAKAFCRAAGMETFSTGVLAVIYVIVYVTALSLCLRWSGIKRIPVLLLCCFLALVVFMDGNYLVWFNSLYGEPVMIIGLMLFAASVLYAISKDNTGFKTVLPMILSAFLFLGSKAQCITAFPIVAAIMVRIISTGQPGKSRRKILRLSLPALPVLLLLFYTLGIYVQHNNTCGVDTKYNAVFYGILKNSDDPQKDLEMLGLPGDLAVEAGKHAYLPQSEYKKYVPWSDITEKEFNRKINNFKLVRFYLLHPGRLIRGMEYTASVSFQTGTFLGKFKKSDISEYTWDFHRFTLWSDFRSSFFPKKLWFIILFYAAILVVSVIEYGRKREDKASRLRIELIWTVIVIGILQFPMPFVGNGEADTAKQLFLFNYTFDMLMIVACTWVISKVFFLNVETDSRPSFRD